MASVTIRGSITPSAHLPRGKVVTVQRTEHIDRLIKQGFVDVLEEHPDAPEGKVVSPEPPAPAPAPEPTPEPAPEPARVEPPHKNASREHWAEYVTSLGLDPGTLSRDELIGMWETYEDDQD
jgi:hypothetical protein